MRESPIFVKTFDVLKWILGHTEKFPKSQRFFLAKRINDAIFDLYELLGEAAVLNDGRILHRLNSADVRLLRLKHYCRLALEMHYLSFRQYKYVSAALEEIGRLLGGWIKSAGRQK